jgi:hypothetical protein
MISKPSFLHCKTFRASATVHKAGKACLIPCLCSTAAEQNAKLDRPLQPGFHRACVVATAHGIWLSTALCPAKQGRERRRGNSVLLARAQRQLVRKDNDFTTGVYLAVAGEMPSGRWGVIFARNFSLCSIYRGLISWRILALYPPLWFGSSTIIVPSGADHR